MKKFVLILIIFLSGCGSAPHYREFDLSKVEVRQGVIIGKIDVEYNSAHYPTAGCRFCVDLDCHLLLNDGYVFIPIGEGSVYNTFLICHYPVLGRGDHTFKVDSFTVKPGIAYFGNLLFSVNSQVTRTSRFYDAIQKEMVENTQYELTSSVSVRDDMPGVVEVFRRHVKNENIEVEKNIFNISSGFTTQEIHVEN